MFKLCVLCSLFILIAIPFSSAAAQDDPAFVPFQRVLIICTDPTRASFTHVGDLCTWSPGATEIRRETTGAYYADVSVAPDGRHAVLWSLSQNYVDARLRGEDPTGGSGPEPYDFALVDLTVPAADPLVPRLVVDQNTLRPAQEDDPFLQRRSTPVWSKDGARFAWVEFDLSLPGYGRIAYYDTRTGATGILAAALDDFGAGDAGEWGFNTPLGWDEALIILDWSVFAIPNADGTYTAGELIRVYKPDGFSASLPIEYFDNRQDRHQDIRWVLHNGVGHVALYYPHRGWVVYDPRDNSYDVLANAPFRQAVTATGWRAHIFTADPFAIEWRGDGTLPAEIAPNLPVTFDPAGTPVWRTLNGQFLILRAGEAVPFLPALPAGLQIKELDWTPAVWVTDGQSTPIEKNMMP